MVKKMPWPVVIMKEDKWYVASCPPLGIATQGKTLEEVKKNMAELISEYLNDPDTPKPKTQIHVVKMTRISVGSVQLGRHASAIKA